MILQKNHYQFLQVVKSFLALPCIPVCVITMVTLELQSNKLNKVLLLSGNLGRQETNSEQQRKSVRKKCAVRAIDSILPSQGLCTVRDCRLHHQWPKCTKVTSCTNLKEKLNGLIQFKPGCVISLALWMKTLILWSKPIAQSDHDKFFFLLGPDVCLQAHLLKISLEKNCQVQVVFICVCMCVCLRVSHAPPPSLSLCSFYRPCLGVQEVHSPCSSESTKGERSERAELPTASQGFKHLFDICLRFLMREQSQMN